MVVRSGPEEDGSGCGGSDAEGHGRRAEAAQAPAAVLRRERGDA